MHDLLSAHGHTAKNRTEIEASTHCGCFYCAKVFSPSDIVAWSGLELIDLDLPEAAHAETALCPQCGSESVIGDKSGFHISVKFLNRMHEAWIARTIVYKPGAKK